MPGGKYAEMSYDNGVREELKSTAKHNKFPERIFAYVDNMLRYKPHIKTMTTEVPGICLVLSQKTGDWLWNKTASERSNIIRDSTKYARKLK